jgi:hypothetical protein
MKIKEKVTIESNLKPIKKDWAKEKAKLKMAKIQNQLNKIPEVTKHEIGKNKTIFEAIQ